MLRFDFTALFMISSKPAVTINDPMKAVASLRTRSLTSLRRKNPIAALIPTMVNYIHYGHCIGLRTNKVPAIAKTIPTTLIKYILTGPLKKYATIAPNVKHASKMSQNFQVCPEKRILLMNGN